MIGDVGLGELALIALIAVVFLGPDKLPELARQAAAVFRKARDFATTARDELRTELGDADLELRDLDPRTIVRKHVIEAMDEAGPRGAPRHGDRPLEVGQQAPYDIDAT